MLATLASITTLVSEGGNRDNFVDIDVGHCWGAPSYVPNSYYGHAQFKEYGKAAKVDLVSVF